jgi:hypothetical protein
VESPEANTRIPLRAYFIWFGRHFPWVNLLALRSAALRGGFEQVVLYHDSDLAGTPYYRELLETPRVTLERLDIAALLERCAPHTEALREVYGRLRTPAMRSDLVRLALLYGQGGVYLDIDTVTLASFEPLCREPSAFCGQERIVFPASVRASRNRAVILGAQLRSRLRDVLRLVPKGYRLFRAIEGIYPSAENNAILASARRGPFIETLLCKMRELAPDAQRALYVIGPHLLQRTVASYRGTDLVVHPPEVFFPLGPEISEHWFRKVRNPDLDQVLSPSTVLVHWYASVRTKHLVPQIDAAYVRYNAKQQLFSALALPFANP